jgi:MYXO-CTERM domain-containing protein
MPGLDTTDGTMPLDGSSSSSSSPSTDTGTAKTEGGRPTDGCNCGMDPEDTGWLYTTLLLTLLGVAHRRRCG